MGFVPINDDLATLRAPLGVDEQPGPRRIEREESVFMPAWRTQNLIGSAFAAETYPGKYQPEPGHDPLSIIGGTQYEERNLFDFVGSESEAETRARMRQIDRENRDRERLDNSGWAGLIAEIAASTIDPTIAIPGGNLVKSVKGGYSFVKSMANVGISGAAAVAAQEAGLHSTQFTRTAGESAMNIASATILAGLLGAGASRFATAAERAAGIKALDQIKAELTPKTAALDRTAFVESIQQQLETGVAGPAIQQGILDALPPEMLDALKSEAALAAKMREAARAGDDAALAELQAIPTDPRYEAARARLNEEIDRYISSQGGATGLAASAGAAASDTRQLVPTEMVPAIVGRAYDKSRALLERAGELPGVRSIPGVRTAVGLAGKAASKVLGVPEWLIKRSGPLTRMAYSESTVGKRAAADLVESPIEYRDNQAGVPTARNGPAVETTARIAIDGARFKLTQELDRLYQEYYFGAAKRFGKARARIDQARGGGEGRLTFKQFKGAIRDAMINNDTHATPEVQAAAQWVRKEIFDPWKEAAIRLKLLPEDVTVKTAASYFMRVYDKQKIVAQRPDFVQRITQWLTDDQEVKAQLKADLQRNRDLRAERTKALRKLERRLETIARRQDQVEARLGERQIEVNRAGQRVDKIKERQSAITDEMTDLDEVIRDLKDTVKNPELKAELQQLERELAQLRRADKPVTLEDLERADKEEEGGILTGPMRRAARIASGQVKAPKPPSLVRWMVQEGGIKDTGGDVLATIGDRRKVPGLIRKENARDLDAWGEKLQQEFPEVFIDRLSPDEVLDLIAGSAIGDEPQWFVYYKMPPDDREAMEMAAMIQFAAERAGVQLKSPADVAELFRTRDPRDLADLEEQINGMAEPRAQEFGKRMPATSIQGATYTYNHLGNFRVGDPRKIGSDAAAHVIREGKLVNGEAILILGNDGSIHADGTGGATTVGMPPEVTPLFDTPGSDLLVHHNHPSSKSLSVQDIGQLSRSGVSVVWAHGNNEKVRYRASLPPALRKFPDNQLFTALWRAHKETNEHVRFALQVAVIQKRLTADIANQIHAHLVTQALHNAGLIDYFSDLELIVPVLDTPIDMAGIIQGATKKAQFVGEVNLDAAALAEARRPGRSARTVRHVGDMGIASPYFGGPPGHSVHALGNDRGRAGGDRAQKGRAKPEQLRFPGFEDRKNYTREDFRAFIDGLKRDREALQNRIVHALDTEGAFTATAPDGRSIIITPSMRNEDLYQLTYLDKNGEASGHSDVRADDLASEAQAAIGRSIHTQGMEEPAYHGSPVRGIKKFSNEKIGTGEGAQAFGWGLYFASDKEIAAHYRRKLAGEGVDVTYKGDSADYVFETNDDPFAWQGIYQVTEKGSVEKAISWLRDEIARPGRPKEANDFDSKVLDWIEANKGDIEVNDGPKGGLYSVEVPDKSELMDWNGKLADQPEAVKAKLDQIGKESLPDEVMVDGKTLLSWELQHFPNAPEEGFEKLREFMLKARNLDEALNGWRAVGPLWLKPQMKPVIEALAKTDLTFQPFDIGKSGELTGHQFYKHLAERAGSEQRASEILKEAGIPGHRFRDANSRGDAVVARWKDRGEWKERRFRSEAEAVEFLDEVQGYDMSKPNPNAEVKPAERSDNYVIYDDSRINITGMEEDGPAFDPRKYGGDEYAAAYDRQREAFDALEAAREKRFGKPKNAMEREIREMPEYQEWRQAAEEAMPEYQAWQKAMAEEGRLRPRDDSPYEPDITETPEFRQWFGASKVVDEDGEPLIVHHNGSFDEAADLPAGAMHFGTAEAARQRSHGKALDDMLMAVETYQDDAGRWHWDDGRGFTSEELDAKGWDDSDGALLAGRGYLARATDGSELGDGGNTTSAWLSIKNPKRMRDLGGANGEWDKAVADAKAQGFDGIVYRNEYEDKGSDSWIAFEPSQMKSVNNKGDFDPRNPNMLAEDGDRILPPNRDRTIPIRVQSESMENAVNVRHETIDKLKAEIERFKGYRQTAENQAGREGARGSEAALRLRDSVGGVKKKDGTLTRGRRGVLQDRSARLDTAREIMERARANVQTDIDDLRLAAEEKLLDWQGKSAGDAKAALKRRDEQERIRGLKKEAGVYNGKDERLTGADKAVDAAIKRIIRSDRDKIPAEIESLANEIVDRIIGSPDGRLPYDLPTGGPQVGPPSDGPPPRGPLAHREFMIPDEMIKDWLVDDVEQVAHTYLGSIVPDVLITERFGDVDMTQVFRQINEEYNAKIKASSSERERQALRKEQERVIGDLAAMRDRLRGTYGITSDTVMRNAARIAGAAGSLNTLADMGGSALSQLPDLAGPIFRHGFGTVFRDGWMPFFKNLSQGGKGAVGKAKRQYNAMGIAIDMVHNTRNLDEVGEQYHPRTKGERMLKGGAQAFMNVNLSAPMTDMAKTIAAVVAGNEIFRAVKAVADDVAAGRALSVVQDPKTGKWENVQAGGKSKATQRQITDLAAASIDRDMAVRIWQSFQEAGAVEDGVYLPNTADWSDAGARRAFEGAVSREANIAVVTPGQEKALWLSNPVLKILGQFKAFIASSSVRIAAANLQRRDAAVLQGVIGSIAMGMLGYKAYTMATGQEASDRWEDWVKEGISRAGVLGWLDEGNSFASKFTRGQLDLYRAVGADKPLTRYASRGVLGALLGPTAGKIENAAQVAGAAASGDFSAPDTRAARRLMPLQNLFYIRGLLNQVESGFNERFGIPERRQQ